MHSVSTTTLPAMRGTGRNGVRRQQITRCSANVAGWGDARVAIHPASLASTTKRWRSAELCAADHRDDCGAPGGETSATSSSSSEGSDLTIPEEAAGASGGSFGDGGGSLGEGGGQTKKGSLAQAGQEGT
jgi:hypothetical protein